MSKPHPKYPPFTRRPMAEQHVPQDAAPCFRSQEGEFVFMGPQRAANEARMQYDRDADERSRTGQWNVPMFLCTAVIFLFIAAIGAGMYMLIAGWTPIALDFAKRNPATVNYILAGLAAGVLALAVALRLNQRPGVL